MDDFFTWVHAAKAATPGRNLATKALGYAANQEAELRRVLDHGELPLDNTRVERALRKIVVGRKIRSRTSRRYCASCPTGRAIATSSSRPKYWRATRGRLRSDELASPISSFEIPVPFSAAVEPVAR